MRRFASMVAAAVVMLSLTACEEQNSSATDPLAVSLNEFSLQYSAFNPEAANAAQELVDEIRSDAQQSLDWSMQMERVCDRIRSTSWDEAYEYLVEPEAASTSAPQESTVESYMMAATAEGSFCPELRK